MSNEPDIILTLTSDNIVLIILIGGTIAGIFGALWKMQIAAKNATIETLRTKLEGGEERLRELESGAVESKEAIEEIQEKLAAKEPVPVQMIEEATAKSTATQVGIARLIDEIGSKIEIQRKIIHRFPSWSKDNSDTFPPWSKDNSKDDED